jgi:hypothetical protein
VPGRASVTRLVEVAVARRPRYRSLLLHADNRMHDSRQMRAFWRQVAMDTYAGRPTFGGRTPGIATQRARPCWRSSTRPIEAIRKVTEDRQLTRADQVVLRVRVCTGAWLGSDGGCPVGISPDSLVFVEGGVIRIGNVRY